MKAANKNWQKLDKNPKVGWVLWHINFCMLFNAKSIFMKINSSISSNPV